jgi:phenylacetate-CoA ligase
MSVLVEPQQHQLSTRQLEIVAQLVERVRAELPYYRDAIPAGLTIRSREDVLKLPIMTKEMLRKHFRQLLPTDEQGEAIEWWSTSGTTTDRVQVAWAKGQLKRGHQRTFALHKWKLDQAKRRAAILSSPICTGTQCHMDMSLSYEDRVISEWTETALLSLNSGMNPSRFGVSKLEEMIGDLDRFRANTLAVDAAYFMALARYMLAEGISLRTPIVHVLVKDQLTSKIHKRAICEALGVARVTEVYGMTEAAGEFAVECEHGNLHYSHEHMLLEVVDRSFQPVPAGGLGRVCITTLDRSVMPLVRYLTGDLALAAPAECRCGLAEPAIGLIQGRIQDLVTTTAGAPVTTRQVDDAVAAAARGIDWYAVLQRGPARYSFDYVPSLGARAVHDPAAAVVDALKGLLGNDADVQVYETMDIAPQKSGKYRTSGQDPVLTTFEL